MTTLPSHPERRTRASRPTPDLEIEAPIASVSWRALRFEDTGRPGRLVEDRIEASLHPTAVVLVRRSRDGSATPLVLPARATSQTGPHGRILEWRLDDGLSSEATVRIWVDGDRPPILRTTLLSRLGIPGGRFERLDLEIHDRPDDAPSEAAGG